MRPIFFLPTALMCGIAAAATVYKWVDEKGVTHYSDQPRPGAQRIEIQSAQTYAPPPPPAPSAPASAPQPEAAPAHQCTITRPSADEVFMNAWAVSVQFRVEPALRPTDRLYLVMDDAQQSVPPAATEYVFSPIARGTHTVSVVAESADGQPLCRGAPVTFHVRQPSIRAPNPQNRPRF